MKRCLRKAATENNEKKSKICKLEAGLLAKEVQLSVTSFRSEKLEQRKTKLLEENESLQVTEQEIVDLRMNPVRPKRSKNAPQKLSKAIKERYLAFALSVVSSFKEWCRA